MIWCLYCLYTTLYSIILHSSENSQIDSKNVELGAVVPYNLHMATLSCQVYWGSPILHRFLLASSINSYQFANCFMSLKYAPTESFRFALRRVTGVFQVGPWKHLQRGVPWPCPNVHGTLLRTSLWCLFTKKTKCHLNVTYMSPYVSISAEIHLKSTKFQLWLVTSCHWRFNSMMHHEVPHAALSSAVMPSLWRATSGCVGRCSKLDKATKSSILQDLIQCVGEKNQKSKRFERFWVYNLMERLMWTNFAQYICERLTWRNGHVDTIRPPVVLLTDSMSWLTVSVLHGWQISLKPCNTFGCYFVHFSQETYQKDP